MNVDVLWSFLAKDETVFLGEDYQILLPAGGATVIFKPRIGPARELEMMKNGEVINARVKLSTTHLNHLILENVGESDEGVYIIRSEQNPNNIKQLNVIVRGDTQHGLIKFFRCLTVDALSSHLFWFWSTTFGGRK